MSFKRAVEVAHPYAWDLLQWIISSNRAHFIDIPPEVALPNVGTVEQYIMLMDSPEKEARFKELKEEYGTTFAFHGSSLKNWHSILRNGLINATGTVLERSGHAHGAGIYLSPNVSFALGYCKNRDIRCLALCEVVNHEINKKTSDIWTIDDSEKVCTRFLFVYTPECRKNVEAKFRNQNFNSTKPDNIRHIHRIFEHFSIS